VLVNILLSVSSYVFCFSFLQSTDDVIRVDYIIEQSSVVKQMNLQELKDIQSRLMLIIGNDSAVKEEVDRFVEVRSFKM